MFNLKCPNRGKMIDSRKDLRMYVCIYLFIWGGGGGVEEEI